MQASFFYFFQYSCESMLRSVLLFRFCVTIDSKDEVDPFESEVSVNEFSESGAAVGAVVELQLPSLAKMQLSTWLSREILRMVVFLAAF